MSPRKASCGAGVAIDLISLGIDKPDIGTIGRNAFNLRTIDQPARAPRPQPYTTGVIDVHVPVRVHCPHGIARCAAGNAAWRDITSVQRVTFIQTAGWAVFKGLIVRRIIHHVKLRFVITVGHRHVDRVGCVKVCIQTAGRAQEHTEENIPIERRIICSGNRHGLWQVPVCRSENQL